METYINICKIDSQWYLQYDSGNSNQCSVKPRGVQRGGQWERVLRGRRHMYTYD